MHARKIKSREIRGVGRKVILRVVAGVRLHSIKFTWRGGETTRKAATRPLWSARFTARNICFSHLSTIFTLDTKAILYTFSLNGFSLAQVEGNFRPGVKRGRRL